MARQQERVPASGEPVVVGEAHRGEEGARCGQGEGEGAEGREGV
jgi:hypothetical protein